jgi:hypothetical protein
MLVRILWNLDLYLTVDQRQMTAIDADYSARVGKNPMEEKKGPKTSTWSASKKGEDSKSSDKKCYKSNNRVNVKLWHQQECKLPSYVRHCITLISEDR